MKRRPQHLRWDRVTVDAIDVSDGGLHESVFVVIEATCHRGPHQEVWQNTQLQVLCGCGLKKTADAAATSAAPHHESATSSMIPPPTTVANADPMHVELAKDEAIPTTNTGGAAFSSAGPVSMEQAQFDVEITQGDSKAQRS